jgi:class 3 adenylate cyclase/tetratricopeptide (TPR) repeat protein
VSVLFCDLVGFTAASEEQDPEDVRARIRPYHARLRQEIERYGATVEKFVGDAVMAVCGAPVAHEDDAERAVRAGLAILDAIGELNEADPDLDLKVRVGINTGEAVVAVGAQPEHGEGLVTGDVVNTAARIESAAPVNGVAVGEQTYRATSHIFEYEQLQPVSVKGKAEPLSLWRAKAIRDRFGRDSTREYKTPFVGRELEKPLLIGIFERAAQQRSVQLVTIVGEPGVGKSSNTDLSRELEGPILERAGGNPLYAEEFVRLLADRGLDQPGDALAESTLPESLQALIAARLDTLSPERKSLLQDAAVVGKVFWTGALAEIGGREPGDLELALHELARKELVRPARTSSMEGESEFSFWHLLVRDVAYGQIPRAERARRHRAAAAWIERKAGERVEDLAEVLAHHYVQALELSEAAGDIEQAEELVGPARRFLALAGERALGLDTAQAEARLARALELTPSEDVERPDLLVRWADAALQAGHPRKAAEALEQALASLRARGRTEAAARALQLRSRVAFRLGDGGMWLALATQAVELLEPEGPGPALVDAYTQLASARAVVGAYPEATAAADRARSLAETLGIREPARALGYRGYARVWLGDADGLDDMERALGLLVEEGAGRDAATVQNNLAIARYPLQGSARALADFEDGIAFCEQRGLAEPAGVLECNCPALLAELGRTEEALERAGRLAAVAEASGDAYVLIELRSVELANRFARGEREASPAGADWVVERARAIGTAEMIVVALGPAAAALAAEAPERASALLAQLEQVPGARKTPYYSRQLAAMLRTAFATGDPDLAKRLAGGLEPRYPLDDHALCAARAQLAEHAGDHADAADLYAEAAARWQEFGNVPERAHALLGQGRCLRALGRPEAEEPLREARDLFAEMGYRPALAETEALLAQVAAPTR